MGYDLHITRAEFWAENEGQEISAEEWLELVDSDPLLAINNRNGPYFAELDSPNADDRRWLDWSEGNIFTRHPDRETLAKMLQVAGQLGASIQGDDGEPYEDVDSLSEPEIATVSGDREPVGIPEFLKRETSRNWLMYALVILAVLAINLLDLW